MRHLVVAPSARRRGVGSALMEETAQHLRAAGKTGWRLNVGSTNAAARRPLRAPRPAAAVPVDGGARAVDQRAALPTSRVAVRELPAATRRGARAPLRAAARSARRARAATSGSSSALTTERRRSCVGLAVFSPSFPGAFPFRALTPDAVQPLRRGDAPARRGPPPRQPRHRRRRRRSFASSSRPAPRLRGHFLHLGGAL